VNKNVRAAVTPQLVLTRQGAKNLNDVRFKWGDRLKKGQELMLLEAAGIIMEAVKRRAPDEVGGVKNYADKLEVGLIGSEEESTVVILLKEAKRELGDSKAEKNTIVLISIGSGASDAVKALARFQPWPASILPFQPSGRGVKVVSRTVSTSEVARLRGRILSQRVKIEHALRRAGVRGAKVEDGSKGRGTEVSDDIAFSVLRREFGLADRLQPHWRPALKEVQSSLKQLGRKLEQYVLTGKDSVFSLPAYASVSASEVTTFQPFQDKIAKAAGLS